MKTRTSLPALLLAGAALSALAGCKIDDRPLLARGEPAPMQFAVAPGPYEGALIDLPPAPPVPVSYLEAEQAYLYPERAYRFERAAYRQQPDYAFAYQDEQPWAWARDDGTMFAEPYDDGYRFYYYEPDEPYPYFVRDDQYGYAYGDDGVLLALFDAAGALLAPNLYPQYAPVAGRYWVHAQDLNRTYRAAPRYPIEEAVWAQTAPRLYAVQDPWFRAAETYEPWREVRARSGDNGRHLGWYKDKGKDKSWDGHMPVAAPSIVPVRATPDRIDRPGDHRRANEAGRDMRDDRGHGRDHKVARAATDSGRDASARGPERRAERQERRHEFKVAENRPQAAGPARHEDRGSGQGKGPDHGGGKPDRGDKGGHGGGHGGGDKGGGHGGDKGGHGGGKGK